MSDCSPKQLCFPPIAGQTLRADFEASDLQHRHAATLPARLKNVLALVTDAEYQAKRREILAEV